MVKSKYQRTNHKGTLYNRIKKNKKSDIYFVNFRILKYKPPENVADEFRQGLVQGDKQVDR